MENRYQRNALEDTLSHSPQHPRLPSQQYPKRTEQNVIDSDGTVIFTHGKLSGGSDLTRKYSIIYCDHSHCNDWFCMNFD